MTLLNLGHAYRDVTGPPQRFALRIYLPQEDLEAHYAPDIPRAMDPFDAGVHELIEQLGRVVDLSAPALPPAHEPLWTIPFSTAPSAATRLTAAVGDFPVFHPPQRLRRSLRLFSAANSEDAAQLLPLLISEHEVKEAAESVSAEVFFPLYVRESTYVVPMTWFAAFAAEDHVMLVRQGREIHEYVVPADTAAHRVLRAAEIVEQAALSSISDADEHLSEEAQQAKAFADELTRLGRWLGTFSATSLVVLEYGSLADRLQPDESPQDLADAVELLAEHDLPSATAALRRIFTRWAPLAHMQRAN